MKKFTRRYYHSLRQIGGDLVWPLRNRNKLRAAMSGELVSFAMRERLMLAVTAVNDCRYCSYFHAKEALRAELPESEIRHLLEGNLHHAPANELPALLYAQHWAESDGQPDLAAQQTLYATYGAEKAEAIEAVLRMIRTGNLGGNTLDYVVYRLSFGRLGKSQRDELKTA